MSHPHSLDVGHTSRALAGVAACGIAITLLLWSQARVPDLLAGSPHYLVPAHGYVAVFGASFLLYLLALRLARAAVGHPGRLLLMVGVGAVVMRLVLLPAPPTLTTDPLRYRWDGRVARQGINPYRYPPDEPSLRDLRFPGWERINYPGTRTPYPPLAQVAFWFNAACLGDTILGLKLLFTAFDLATACLLLLMLRALGRPPSDVMIYAWHPLVVTETALSGHQDALGVFFLVAALWCVTGAARRLGAGVALGLSIAAKGIAVLYLPAMARRWGWRLLVAACAVNVALYTPFLLAGTSLQGGAQSMARMWEANSSLYAIVERLFAAGLPGAPEMARPVARVLVGLLVLGFALWLGCRVSNRPHPTPDTPERVHRPAGDGKHVRRTPTPSLIRDLYLVTMVLFLLSPVVMPWYLVWVVPLLVFHRAPAGYVFSAVVVLSYLITVGRWRWWHPWVEYLPVYGLFAVELLRDLGCRREGTRACPRVETRGCGPRRGRD